MIVFEEAESAVPHQNLGVDPKVLAYYGHIIGVIALDEQYGPSFAAFFKLCLPLKILIQSREAYQILAYGILAWMQMQRNGFGIGREEMRIPSFVLRQVIKS